ncbi:cell division ATP-binding protein FtsE [Solemya velum gill symbiont]|uniref:cell division ATP-binding protein FtsE n=1 Tax=Solemya velum gill symbiont TaxID=2340 RepID=UPI00099830E8|nr:cell division ATP-binding protein FtsE [Solemya velum gill symbiont]OOZ46365.1 cell division ATP-binding protein FtsE [Solemya velum gill symbiont]OOZ47190.1 cell division ATP-binding protein FtsE [Solemya velum gill symbiont]OOZ48981.1 cell division ATP-binding protein FtsE [Solemya velum gill symbiont]OOZ52290.1 cell division ATP-binding protein FtsE [Solemya velum gill symbiont]OOZ55172.1 cell division ATP-binding protein FtsE [Solemya velum gill symbiont]
MIHFDHVSKRFEDGQYGLKQINLQIEEGAMAFITGHSGAGKSTLMRLIALLDRPTRGQLIVDGRNMAKLPNREIPFHRRKVGMIFQDHRLLNDRSVYENVALPLQVIGASPRDSGKRVRAALDKIGLLKKEKSLPASLSGGEQQRVGIARALVTRPPILLADEPTGNLDPELSREIMDLFLAFNQIGVTTLIASHDLALINQLNRPVIKLHEGSIARV